MSLEARVRALSLLSIDLGCLSLEHLIYSQGEVRVANPIEGHTEFHLHAASVV